MNDNVTWLSSWKLSFRIPRMNHSFELIEGSQNQLIESSPLRTKFLRGAIATATCANLWACTSIEFYESKNSEYRGNKDEKGFLYYPPKPYLLVEQTKEGEKFNIVSIPDTSRPHRVKQIPGFGTGELGFEMNSGMIVKFNSKTDSKTPEIITALAGIGTAKAALDTAKAAMEAARKTIAPVPAEQFVKAKTDSHYDVVPFVESITKLQAALATLKQPAQGTEIFRIQVDRIETQIKELESRKTITYPIDKPDEFLKKIDDARRAASLTISELSSVNEALKTYSSNVKEFENIFADAQLASSAVEKSIELLSAFVVSEPSSAGLYEIEYINGRLVLRKVGIK